MAAQIEPRGRYDGCFLTRRVLATGNIHGHEMAWAGGELWVVNTLFSCLCTLHDEFSFVPRWRPPFVRQLAAEDRCHLNGLAVRDERPAYVTAMAASDEAAGWRPTKATSGCVVEVAGGEIVARRLGHAALAALAQRPPVDLFHDLFHEILVRCSSQASNAAAENAGLSGRWLGAVNGYANTNAPQRKRDELPYDTT